MIKLRTYCQRRGAPAPSDQVVFEALNNLLAKRILGLTSEYFFSEVFAVKLKVKIIQVITKSKSGS